MKVKIEEMLAMKKLLFFQYFLFQVLRQLVKPRPDAIIPIVDPIPENL